MNEHIDVGIKDGVLTYSGPDWSISLPWPCPECGPRGAYVPHILETYPDGSAVGVWRFEYLAPPWQRADRPDFLNVPPHTQLLEDHGLAVRG